MKAKLPEEVEDIFLIAAATLAVALITVIIFEVPPLVTAEEAVRYSIAQIPSKRF